MTPPSSPTNVSISPRDRDHVRLGDSSRSGTSTTSSRHSTAACSRSRSAAARSRTSSRPAAASSRAATTRRSTPDYMQPDRRAAGLERQLGRLRDLGGQPSRGRAGQNVVLRWRMGSDDSVSGVGWRIDTIVLTDGYTCCTPTPQALAVDVTASASAEPNGVWEPGETVVVAPAYFNGDTVGARAVGDRVEPDGPAGRHVQLTDAAASYGSIAPGSESSCAAGGNCYAVWWTTPRRPGPALGRDVRRDALDRRAPRAGPSISGRASRTSRPPHLLQVHRDDLPQGGHGRLRGDQLLPGQPGPAQADGRLPAEGPLRRRATLPPAAVGIFGDVPPADPFAPWIEDLYNRGDHGRLRHRPSTARTTRCSAQQMAVFLLKTPGRLRATRRRPAPAVFGDVPCPSTVRRLDRGALPTAASPAAAAAATSVPAARTRAARWRCS